MKEKNVPWFLSFFTLGIVVVGSVLNKILFTMPELVLPSPKEQLNTQFEESKVLFKFVDLNNLSTVLSVVFALIIVAVWVKVLRGVKK